jgi:predicted secreted protein
MEAINMKKLVILGLVAVMLLPLLVIGCGGQAATTPTIPSDSQTIEITLDQFSEQSNILQTIDMPVHGTLTVKVGSNPSTGYSWGEPRITPDGAAQLASHNYVAPTSTGLVGAAGTDVWVFSFADATTATIKISYGQPWEGGAKDTYILTILVRVNYYLGGPSDQ